LFSRFAKQFSSLFASTVVDDVGFLSGITLFILLGFIGCLLLAITGAHRATLRFQIRLFLAAYGLRFTMSLILYAFGLVNLIKDEDGSGWLAGVGYHRSWVEQSVGLGDLPEIVAEVFLSSNKGYYYLLALMYCFIEPSRLPAAALNCFFGAFAIVFAYRTAASLFSTLVARRVGIWLCIFPSMIIWSAQTVKEPVVILLETVAVYGCVRLRQVRFSLPHLVMTLICIVFLIPFRFYAAYLAAAALVASSLFPASGRGGFNIGAKLGAVAICSFFVTTGILAHHESEARDWDLERFQNVRSYVARTTGSGFDAELDVRTPGGFGLSLLIGAAHLLLAPFPWQLASGSARMLMVAPEMVYWWWLVFAGVLPGLRFSLRHRLNDVLPLLAILIGFGLLYSVTFSNVGLIYRQRAQLMPWLLTFAAVGLEQRRQRRLARLAARRPQSGDLSPIPSLEPPGGLSRHPQDSGPTLPGFSEHAGNS
jgi:hypothetical protein